MIRFLKRTRQKLIKERNVQKYLIYGLGEILLIVIGILIALQISNWNDNKKSKKLGLEMISEIRTGLDSDLNELNRFLQYQEMVLKSQLIISEWLKNDEEYQDTLSRHFSRVYITTDYSINYSGYETLKRFGLKRVENDTLRIAIANLYEIKYPEFIKFSEVYQNFLDELLKVNPRHFNELNYMQNLMHPRDGTKLKEDSEYLYYLNTLKNFNKLLLYQGHLLKEELLKTEAIFQ